MSAAKNLQPFYTLKDLKVFVYYNLHKSLWSVKALEGPHKGRVVAHASTVGLLDVTPKVSEAGRQRVLKEQKKNVHAGLVGRILDISNSPEDLSGAHSGRYRALSYNPYRGPQFYYKDAQNGSYEGSRYAWLASDRQVYEVLK